MPSHARRDIVGNGEIAVYHTWSRCVQRAWLCGEDPLTGFDYNHRREWIESLLEHQASLFAVDVGGFHLLGNHQHLICRTRPDLAAHWTPEELAWRWKSAWPRWDNGQWLAEPTDEEIRELLAHPEKIERIRNSLSSLSWFMARWKEPIARLANKEMNRTGHFYESRFGSRLLADEREVLICSLYVDVNQVAAGAVDSLEDSDHSSIQRRIVAWRQRESQECSEAFRRSKGDPGHQMEATAVEQLLADSWLAPIAIDSPLATVKPEEPTVVEHGLEQGSSVEIREPGSVSNDDILDDDRSEAMSDEPETLQVDSDFGADHVDGADDPGVSADMPTAPTTTAGSRPRRKPRDQASRTIHRRLRERRRRRASDNCILPIPWRQYHDMAEWAAARQVAARVGAAAEGRAARLDRPSSPADAEPTETPSNWRRSVRNFSNWLLRSLVDAGGALAELAAAIGLTSSGGDPNG